MKTIFRNLAFACMVMLVFSSVLPVPSALAAKEKNTVTLSVRNHTSGQITIRFTDENGVTYWATLEAGGKQKVSLPEGRYSYRTNTLCGAMSGDLNLNVSKSLHINCKDGLEVTLVKSVKKNDCTKQLWVEDTQWFELNQEWWPWLLDPDNGFESELRCFDSSLEAVNTPFGL
jgi:hypothetical protein